MNRRHRLTGRRRIAAVWAAGSQARSGVVRIRGLSNGGGVSRAAVTVPGARGAVERNRGKRRLRSAIAPQISLHPGLDMVVNLPASSVEMPFSTMCDAVADALRVVSLRQAPGARR